MAWVRVIYHMFSGELPPPPEIDVPALAERDPALEGVDRVLQRMLALQPAARFTSPVAAATMLRQALRLQIDVATDDMEESQWTPQRRVAGESAGDSPGRDA